MAPPPKQLWEGVTERRGAAAREGLERCCRRGCPRTDKTPAQARGTPRQEVPGQEGRWKEEAREELPEPGSSPEELPEPAQRGNRRESAEGTAARGGAHAQVAE